MGATTSGRSSTTASGSGARSRPTWRLPREMVRSGGVTRLVAGQVDLDAEALAEGASEGGLTFVAVAVAVALQQKQRLADDGEAEEVVGMVLEEGVMQARGVG